MSNENNTKKEKASFDRTVCFTFFSNWLEMISKLETNADRNSAAYMLFKAIANYALFEEEPVVDDDTPCMSIISAVWPILEQQIDSSQNRRKRGFLPERSNEIRQAIITETVNHPDASIREIARLVGTSKSNVERIQKRFAKEIQQALANGSCVCDMACTKEMEACAVPSSSGYNSDCISSNPVRYNACATYSLGQGQLGQQNDVEYIDDYDIPSDCNDEGDMPF